MPSSSSSSSSALSSFLSPSPKEKWSSLPLANIFTEAIIRGLIEQGFLVIKEQGRLDEKLRDYATQIANIICERYPGIFLDPNDVMTICGTFMTSSDENVVSTDVVIHTVELDRGGVVDQEGSSSSTVEVPYYFVFFLLPLVLPVVAVHLTMSNNSFLFCLLLRW